MSDSAPRLIVVSNRLPVTISKDDKGEYHFKMSSGGLVSALSGCKKTMSFTWIGWPGIEIPLKDRAHVNQRLMDEFQCQAVYLSDDVADKHYNGFSNSILWPLFHYHPGEMNFDESHWLAYRAVNLTFAQVVLSQVQKGDMVWVQDYHLMLLPMLLRGLIAGQSAGPEGTIGGDGVGSETQKELGRVVEGIETGAGEDQGEMPKSDRKPDAGPLGVNDIKIGFFLHTPFPSSEIYRILPVRREILLGILHCDLIGFHTYDYARHFLSACTRILGLSTMPNGVFIEGRYAHVGTFPIGIEPGQFYEALQKDSVQKRIKQLEQRFEGVKLIVGVDRLDYIKGVPQKLHALEIFLTEHPEWVGKVVLVQLAVPSRQDVEEYQNLRAVVNELVGRINGRFGTVEFMPIHFMHKSVGFEELVAMYNVADACLVTSTRDGMNLVSYEYVCTQAERHGSMILSEFAGAAQSLNGSLIINPWDVHATASAIHEAMVMEPKTREANFQKLSKYVNKYTAEFWGTTFVNELKKITMDDKPSQVARELADTHLHAD